jgi:nucleotide-binding universal stress UspA family protein
MKRIICGTDFSAHAAEAANVAAALAVRNNATLTLLHAVAPWEVEMLDKVTIDAIRGKRRRMLIAEANRLRATGAQVLENLVLGTPHDMLVARTPHVDADLIVVSSHGEISTARWIAGSVALRTALKATEPALVVRDHARLMAWAKGERPLNVFVGYDFSPTSDAVLRWVGSLREWGPCNVTVAYVSWPPQESWRLGMTGRTTEGDNTPEVKALLERSIKEQCERLLGGAETKIHVVSSWGRADVHLNELAKASSADLVVVGLNHRNMADRFWFGSVARGIIRHSRTNVVCVPGTYVGKDARADADKTHRVLVPIDFTEASEQAVAIAFASAPRGAEVCLFHATPTLPDYRIAGAPREDASAETQKIETQLEALARKHGRGRRIRTRVEVVGHRHPPTAICQAAERFNADVIHMASRGGSRVSRKFRKSVADAVKRRTCRPVTVVPA